MHSVVFRLSLVFCLFIFLCSCDNKRIYEKNIAVTDAVWNIDEKPSFEVDVKDTISKQSFYINLRNSGAYPYSNIFLFIETLFPDSSISKDTVECFLADASGKWLGKGSSNIWDNQILFKKGVVFPKSGVYKFTFQHGMRTDELKEILDVGLRIEKEN
jgi:gliding motility-associated lipoprotein GldH